MVAAALVTNLASLWAEANADQRRRLAAEIFIAVYCDLDARQVVALQMNRALLPLRSALPTSVSWSGSDGHPVPIPYIRFPEELAALAA